MNGRDSPALDHRRDALALLEVALDDPFLLSPGKLRRTRVSAAENNQAPAAIKRI